MLFGPTAQTRRLRQPRPAAAAAAGQNIQFSMKSGRTATTSMWCLDVMWGWVVLYRITCTNERSRERGWYKGGWLEEGHSVLYTPCLNQSTSELANNTPRTYIQLLLSKECTCLWFNKIRWCAERFIGKQGCCYKIRQKKNIAWNGLSWNEHSLTT